MMKGVFTVFTLVTLALCGVPSARQWQDTADAPFCKYCNMNRAQYAHARVLVEYDDGSRVGTCSIHCAVLDLVINLEKSPISIQVGDYYSKELIDAEAAYWVIGGMKAGVMTKRGKWAFLKKMEAERFISENGGELSTFDAALGATTADMYADSIMIRAKSKLRKMKN